MTTSPQTHNSKLPFRQPQPAESLHQFIQGLNQIFLDAATLEVNTMVVETITGQRFIPLDVYNELYQLNLDHLNQQDCPSQLGPLYLDLRHQLERQYHGLLREPSSLLYDPTVASNTPVTLPPLPNPAGDTSEIQQLQKLLGDRQFRCCLRKMGELKTALDQQKQRATTTATTPGLIYAKTVLQLDGTITNTYAEALLSHPQCGMILQAHQYNIQTSEQQWQGILNFLIGLVQGSLKGRSAGKPQAKIPLRSPQA